MATKTDSQGQGFQEQNDSGSDYPFVIGAIPLDDLKIEEVEYRTQGNVLPHGIFIDGERLNTFSCQPYKSKYDRVLGQLLKSNRSRLIPVLAQFLPEVVKDIGGYELKELATKCSTSPKRLIEGMALGDVLTLLLGVRNQSQGTDIAISSTCPNCGTKNEDKGTVARPFHDLSTVIVKSLPTLKQKLVVEVVLEDGLQIGKDLVKKLYMNPLKLYQAEKIAKAENTDAEDVTMLYEMICGIPCEMYGNVRGQVFDAELYDELSRADLAILRKALQVIQPGPVMSIEMSCFACGFDWSEGISWGRLREFLFIAPTPAE